MTEQFLKFALNEESDQVVFYDLLKSVDYNCLDYSEELNIYILSKYVSLRFLHHEFMDIDELLDILFSKSPIIYYHVVEQYMIEDKEFYIVKILECEAKLRCEKMFQLYYQYYPQLSTYDLTKQKLVSEELKEKLYIISENDPLLNKMIESVLYVRDEKKYEDKKTISSLLNNYTKSMAKFKFDESKKYLDMLNDTRISKHFIRCKTLQLEMVSVEDTDRMAEMITEFIKETELSYECNTKRDSLKNGLRLCSLINIGFGAQRANKKSFLQSRDIVEQYYDQIKIYITDSQKGQMVQRNYHGLMLKALTPLSSHPVEKRDDIKRDIFYHAQKIANIIESVKYRISPNDIVDLFQMYGILSIHHQTYAEKTLELFEKNKDYIFNEVDKNILVFVVNSVANVLVQSHNIKMLKEFYSNLPKVDELTTQELKISMNILTQKMCSIHQLELVMNSNGLYIVENYDVKSNKTLRNEDDKMVCTICYECIENNSYTVIECKHCEKYIGHFLCMTRYIQNKIKSRARPNCPLCRREFTK